MITAKHRARPGQPALHSSCSASLLFFARVRSSRRVSSLTCHERAMGVAFVGISSRHCDADSRPCADADREMQKQVLNEPEALQSIYFPLK